MALLGGFAMTDMLMLKEGFTIVAPDITPLLAIVVFFGEKERFLLESCFA